MYNDTLKMKRIFQSSFDHKNLETRVEFFR